MSEARSREDGNGEAPRQPIRTHDVACDARYPAALDAAKAEEPVTEPKEL
jgi:hypothetical protein